MKSNSNNNIDLENKIYFNAGATINFNNMLHTFTFSHKELKHN